MKKFCHVLGLLSLFAFLAAGCSVNADRYEKSISVYQNGNYGKSTVELSKERAFEGDEVELKINADSGYYFKSISFSQETLYRVESESLVKFIVPGRDLWIYVYFDRENKTSFSVNSKINRGSISFVNSSTKYASGEKIIFTMTPSSLRGEATPIFTEDSLKIEADGNSIEYTVEDMDSGKFSFIMPPANVQIDGQFFLPVFLSSNNTNIVCGNKLNLDIDNKTNETVFDIEIDGVKKEITVDSGKSSIEIDTTGMFAGLHSLRLEKGSLNYSEEFTFNVAFPGATAGWTCVSFDLGDPKNNKVENKSKENPELLLKLNKTDITTAKIRYYWDDQEDDVHERFFDFKNRYSIILDESAPSNTSVLHVWVYDEILKIVSEKIDL